MKSNLIVLLGAVGLCLAAYTANAENVQISTFYPSPYGSYQSLDVTGTATLAATNINGAVNITGTTAITGNTTITGTTTINGGNAAITGNTTMTGNTTVTGSLGVGGAPSAKLDVVGRIRLQDSGGNSGLLSVSCDGTNCWPVYA